MLDALGNLERTNTCGELRESNVGENVVLMGWVAKKRDFGVFTFIDLRDREGVTQVVVSEETAKEAHAKAKNLRGEFVIAVKGAVVKRDEGARNAKLSTGEIEVKVSELLILNDAAVPPFQLEVAGSENLADESTRLKYRYLDLRRPQLQNNIRMRAKAVAKIREYFDNRGFIEIETPILLKSTPEGARDFIVPSRIHTGKFFALPQSPQILKQITMIAGFDKYYQIARCFRDEDLRADRQPEFTQLDMEMSFVNREQVYREMEGMFNHVLKLIDVDLPNEWPRMTYAEAIRRYGSDKPDLRFGMELIDLSDNLRDTDFAPFADVLKNGGEVKAIVVKGKADYSRKHLDELQELAKRYGAGALAWIKVAGDGVAQVRTGSGSDRVPTGSEEKNPVATAPGSDSGITSSLTKVLGEAKIGELAEIAGAENGDAVLIVAGRKSIVAASLGALRNEIARRENLIDRSKYEALIVTEFPMFEHDEETDRYTAAHHPFTSPMDEDLEMFKQAIENDDNHHLLGQVRAKAYDAVINGYECAGGSIRIHQKDVQALNFKALGMSPESAREQFGFFLDALEYGTPPHGGFAAGIERTCMILCGTENIRDVMAFPKTASAQDLMMDSPGEVDVSQLDELGIKISE
ncbi:MAG: aspartate--tRNA ligase [Pyrinomonadaceae bacterium]